jgi:hypothetical protein
MMGNSAPKILSIMTSMRCVCSIITGDNDCCGATHRAYDVTLTIALAHQNTRQNQSTEGDV